MSRIIRLLPGRKFLSGGVLYKPGDILPYTQETMELLKQKKAVVEAEKEDKETITAINQSDEETPLNIETAELHTEDYEEQRVKDLVETAKKRGIELPGGANKAKIIELLRAWDAEHGGKNEGTS